MVTEVNDLASISKGDVIVDFYTSTCGPCKALNPILEEVSNEFKDVTVAKVEVTKSPEVPQQFGVMSVPTVVFLKNAKVQHVINGFSGKESFKSMVRRYYS